jgi:protoporphyrinogen oxidase
VVNDLDKLKLVKKEDVITSEVRSFKYEYVIYDLGHRKNTDCILSYLSSIGIYCCGRFAEFEYMNSDKVVEHAKLLAKKINYMLEVNNL